MYCPCCVHVLHASLQCTTRALERKVNTSAVHFTCVALQGFPTLWHHWSKAWVSGVKPHQCKQIYILLLLSPPAILLLPFPPGPSHTHTRTRMTHYDLIASRSSCARSCVCQSERVISKDWYHWREKIKNFYSLLQTQSDTLRTKFQLSYSSAFSIPRRSITQLKGTVQPKMKIQTSRRSKKKEMLMERKKKGMRKGRRHELWLPADGFLTWCIILR